MSQGPGQLFEDGSKTGLLEMVVRRQGLGQPTLGHHSERDTVRQGPAFVPAAGKEVEASLVYGRDISDHIKQRVRANRSPNGLGCSTGAGVIRTRVPSANAVASSGTMTPL